MTLTRSLFPGSTYDNDLVVPHFFGANTNQGLSYNSASWQKWGQLSKPDDQSYTITAEGVDVINGSPEVTVDMLLSKLTGDITLKIQDLNPNAFIKQSGTNLSTYTPTYNSTWQGGTGSTVQAGTTATVIKVATGHGSGLAQFDLLEIQMIASGLNAYKQFGIIDSVTGDDVTLMYKLEAVPATGATVKKLDSLEIIHGGKTYEFRSLKLQLDFPKGEQHQLVIPKSVMNGGVTRQLSGAVSTPLKAKMLGVPTVISSVEQVMLAKTMINARNTA